MLVLGFDPGYALTGWGAVSCGPPMQEAGYGVIRTSPQESLPVRLSQIFDESARLIEELKPELIVVERLFFSKNTTTAEGVFEARGVLLAASARAGIQVLEVPPVVIKQAVTGSGRARKNDVILMVMRQLNIKTRISPDDAADGLAIAMTGCAARMGGFADVLLHRGFK